MISKITSWAIIFVMVLNTFGILFPLEARAANLERQEASQAAEMEKLQKEAKQSQYKELGLSKVEIVFVEKYAEKLDSFYQYVDKYVSYDPTSGAATLDIAKFNSYANFLQTARVLNLSFAETNMLRRIVLKNIRSYNKNVSTIKEGTDANGNKTTKKIVDRGVEVETEMSTANLDSQATRLNSRTGNTLLSCAQYVYWSNASMMWYGYGVSISFTDCAVKLIALTGGSISKILGILNFLCSSGLVTAGVCTLSLGTMAISIGTIFWLIESTNKYCGERGLIFKWKWFWSGANTSYWQCI